MLPCLTATAPRSTTASALMTLCRLLSAGLPPPLLGIGAARDSLGKAWARVLPARPVPLCRLRRVLALLVRRLWPPMGVVVDCAEGGAMTERRYTEGYDRVHVLDRAIADLETLRLVWERRQFYKLGAQNPSPRGDNPRLLDADELSDRKDWPR